MQADHHAADAHPGCDGLLETAVYVADLDRSEAFYQSVFQFPAFLRDERMRALGVPGGAVLLLFRTGGSEHPSRLPQGVIPGHGATGRTHVCFKIAAATLDRWQHRLDRLGIATESRVTWAAGGTSLYFRDPDAHSVELATPGLWANY